MLKTLVMYESKYGTTEEAAKIIALITGPAKLIRVDEFCEEYKKYDFFIIGSHVHGESMDEKIIKFAVDNRHWLQDKRTALFCTCLSISRENVYFKELKELLGEKCVLKVKALGGRIRLKSIDRDDYNTLMLLSEKTGVPFNDADFFNLKEVVEFALDVKRIRDGLIVSMPISKLKFFVEEFLSCHNTCTLCTSFEGLIRGTPIEYTYRDGYMYFLSKGGEKFANLLMNNDVSISVYDNYENMVKLAGMQLSGKAAIVEHGSREYKRIAEMKGLNIEEILQLPMAMNIIKVKLIKAEFLYSKFKTMGFDTKQIYEFNH